MILTALSLLFLFALVGVWMGIRNARASSGPLHPIGWHYHWHVKRWLTPEVEAWIIVAGFDGAVLVVVWAIRGAP